MELLLLFFLFRVLFVAVFHVSPSALPTTRKFLFFSVAGFFCLASFLPPEAFDYFMRGRSVLRGCLMRMAILV